MKAYKVPSKARAQICFLLPSPLHCGILQRKALVFSKDYKDRLLSCSKHWLGFITAAL